MPDTLPAKVPCFIVYVDIVQFTSYPDSIRDKMIECLRREVKFQLRKHGLPFYNDPNTLEHNAYINFTGDGAVVVLDSAKCGSANKVFEYAVDFCNVFNKEFCSSRLEDGSTSPGKLRAALHYGENKWIFSSVDGGLIVAGEGINKGSRALVIASRNHIIATQGFWERCDEAELGGSLVDVSTQKYRGVKVKNDRLDVFNVFTKKAGNSEPPNYVTLNNPLIGDPLIAQLRVFSDRIPSFMKNHSISYDEEPKFRVSLLTCGTIENGKEILLPHSRRIDQKGAIIDQPSKLVFEVDEGCPGIAWGKRQATMISGLPKTTGEDAQFDEYCKILHSNVNLPKDKTKKFSIREPHFPRAFISLPLVENTTTSPGNPRVWGVVSIDFMNDLVAENVTLSENQKVGPTFLLELNEELRYTTASIATMIPEFNERGKNEQATKN